MRAILLLACLASPAYAAPRHEWDGSSLTLTRCEAGDCWEVTFRNVVSFGSPQLPVTLDLDGFVVTVTHTPGEGPGTAPDTFSVLPPPGYEASPGSLVVEDEATGVIVVSPLPMG